MPEAAPVNPDAVRAADRQRAAALNFEASKDLFNAAQRWRIVLLLQPGDAQARSHLAALESAMKQLVGDELVAARNAQRRGDLDQAQASWLRVLANDPGNEEAVAGLRELDRQRASRRAADRAARARIEESPPLTARARARGTAKTEAGEYDLEQSLELLKAGDAKVAVAELRKYVAANPRDRAGRERIAAALYAQAQQLERQGAGMDAVAMYGEAIKASPAPPREWTARLAQLKTALANREYEQGVRAMSSDVAVAIGHFEAALRLAPDHTQAQLQLERARKMQQRLQTIGTAGKPD